MPGPKPTARPRPMGGFNSNLGGFSEHLDENAMQSAMQQKQLSQQQTSTQQGTGKAGTNPLLDKTNALDQKPSQGTFQPAQPREVGSIKDELLSRPVKDVVKGLASLFDIGALLGIKVEDTPEDQAKKQQLHQRWQKLDQEQQQVAQQKYQAKMQAEKHQREEEEQRQQAEQARAQERIVMPSSPKKGPVGPAGSKRKRTEDMMEHQRKTLGNAGAKH